MSLHVAHPNVLAADEHLWDLHRLAQPLLQLSVVKLLQVDVSVLSFYSHVVEKRKNALAVLECRPDPTEASAVNNDLILLSIFLENQQQTENRDKYV